MTEKRSLKGTNFMAQRFEHIAEGAYLDSLVLEARIKAEFLYTLMVEVPEITKYDDVQSGLRLALEELAWLTRRAEESLDEWGLRGVGENMKQQLVPAVDCLSGGETELLACYRQSGAERGRFILDYARACADATQVGVPCAPPLSGEV